MSSQEPLKILSLDGGGIRGLSSLLILEHIMEKIRDENGLDHVPRPCEHFDLIGGTSTGGIIAIMLGRLRMTVDECIRAYRDLGKRAFSWESPPSSLRKFRRKVATIFTSMSTPDVLISSSSMFSARCLEDAMKLIVKTFCVEAECKSRRQRGQSTARTCPHENMLFRDKTCTKTYVSNRTREFISS
ncbi:hypothetical protein VTN31DRAFT_2872 [Thermomyces dupontii]|uniref:uncharacterized protein n=1 Tax=Talaromyces thermophilus TaxID=28565 RepID=UPI0037431DED